MSHIATGWASGRLVIASMLLTVLVTGGIVSAQDKPAEPPPAAPTAAPAPADPMKELTTKVGDLKVAADTMWVLLTAFLVFFMNLGFASVESGFCRAKNTVAILAKNFIVFAVSSIAFLVLGFGIMFGDGTALFGTQGLWFLSGADTSPATGDAYCLWGDGPPPGMLSLGGRPSRANKVVGPATVLAFHNGRGAQETLFGQLKSQCQVDYVPMRRLLANQIFLLAGGLTHNLGREWQMTIDPPARSTTPQRTPFWVFHELQTLRRTLLLRAGRLTRPHGELTLTVSANLEVREELQRHLTALSAAA